jgi:hypothetical protein
LNFNLGDIIILAHHRKKNKDMHPETLSPSIFDAMDATLCGNLFELSSCFADTSLDLLSPDNPLTKLPIASVLLGSAKTIISVRDSIFVNKIFSFLGPSSEIPDNKRTKEIMRIQEDAKYRVKVGETVLNIIDKSQDSNAALCVGYLFCRVLAKEVPYDDFIYCSNIINSIPYGCLYEFIKKDPDDLSDDGRGIITYSGLCKIEIEDGSVEGKDKEQIEAEKNNSFSTTEWMKSFAPLLNMPIDPVISFASRPSEYEIEDEKYKATASGGKFKIIISRYGALIKETLCDRI